MNFSQLASSKAFVLGAAYLFAVSVVAGVVVVLAGPEWAIIALFLLGSLLFLMLQVELRLRLSRLAASVAGLKRLEQEARDAMKRCLQGLEQLHQISAAGDRELSQALDLLSVDLQARYRANDAQIGALKSEYVERSVQLERRGRTANEQLRGVGQDLKQLQTAIERLEGAFDPSHAGSLGGDVHRTLRSARAIERSLKELGVSLSSISRSSDLSPREFSEVRAELLAQKKLLQELLAYNDFK